MTSDFSSLYIHDFRFNNDVIVLCSVEIIVRTGNPTNIITSSLLPHFLDHIILHSKTYILITGELTMDILYQAYCDDYCIPFHKRNLLIIIAIQITDTTAKCLGHFFKS